jgi:hypothetical protein
LRKYIGIVGEIFSPYINYWDTLPEIETLYLKAPPFKKGALCMESAPIFKMGALSMQSAIFFKMGRFV